MVSGNIFLPFRLPCPSSVPSFSTPRQLWSRPCSGLGRNIRTARLRRRWRLEDVAERMGMSRFTVAEVERGKPGTSIAAYLGALWVLGLLDQLEVVADPDRDGEGKALEAARQPGQAPRRHRIDDDF
jgi:DNA-binding XRE family transcriptional regulator